jgi:hypothetical protein
MKDFVGDLLLKWVITKTITEHASLSNAQKSSSKGILFPIGNKSQIRILDPF